MDTNLNAETTTSPVRQGAVNGLAVLGFIALVAAGVWLALYSTRYVPAVVSRIGSAAVYIGSVFNSADGNSSLSVVPTTTPATTLIFGTPTAPMGTPTAPAAGSANTTGTTQTTSASKPATATNAPTGEKTTTASPVNGTATAEPAKLSGLGDLAVSVTTTGYLTTTSTDSFVASTTVPHGDNPAVRFTIKNVGTNYSGTWTFTASIPTYPAFTFTSQPQQSLAPGDSIDYTLGFNQATQGTNQVIKVTIAPGTADSNASNNSATAAVNVLP
jgi:hypothetical protein